MFRRAMDIAMSALILILASPLLLIAGVAIKLSSPGPVFYVAQRVGKGMQPFRLYKLRTMHVAHRGSSITAPGDRRVFPAGRLLRLTKIDELPQLYNVFRGEMSIVGPRPEDPAIVSSHYRDWMKETLEVKPGVTGPGSLFYYAAADMVLDAADTENSYVRLMLPPKLAMDRAYMDRATAWSDLHYAFLTLLAIGCRLFGRSVGPLRKDVDSARRWCGDIPDWA